MLSAKDLWSNIIKRRILYVTWTTVYLKKKSEFKVIVNSSKNSFGTIWQI